MAQGAQSYDGLTVSVRRRDDQGSYDVGVWIDGAFCVFTKLSTGRVDKWISIAADEAAHAAAQAPPSQPAPVSAPLAPPPVA